MKKAILCLFALAYSISFTSCNEDVDCWTFTIKAKTGTKTTTSYVERCDLTEEEAELYRKFLEGEEKTGSTKVTTTVTKERKK